jgi:hypothetical protein
MWGVRRIEKMRRSSVMALATVIMVFLVVGLAFAGPGEIMTNAEFVEILLDLLELPMPPEVGDLSVGELFTIQAELLAKRGINQFLGLRPYAPVVRSTVCSVLSEAVAQSEVLPVEGAVTRGSLSNVFGETLFGYSALGGEDFAGYLEGLGCGDPEAAEDAMVFDEVIAALNIPALSARVEEAYSAPENAGKDSDLTVEGLYPRPEDVPEEGPASAIF